MANSWFRFKGFLIEQANSPLKVCTDACLFGAWIATVIQGEHRNHPVSVLDIGTGTGLLTLMVAQKNPKAKLVAIELNTAAASDADKNFNSSDFQKNITLVEGDINTFRPERQFDFILSNPPFFENDLKSPDAGRSSAMHVETLSMEALALAIDQNVTVNGKAAVLLAFRSIRFEKLMEKRGWFVEELITVKQTPGHTPFRKMILFQKNKETAAKTAELTIKNSNAIYSPEFIALLKDYYLYL